MLKRIDRQITDSAACIRALSEQGDQLAAAATLLLDCLHAGGRVFSAGNGGSAAEALHLAEELSGRFLRDRQALPGISLCADATAMTCIANDYGFDSVFSRQLEAFGQAGDVFVGFSTSGNSRNVVKAVEVAQVLGVRTICLLGRDGGQLSGCGDVEVIVRHTETARIQEAHQVILHVVLEEIDRAYAPEDGSGA